MRVAIRCDAGGAIGTGHLMRCLTLADYLAARGAECSFVMRDRPDCGAGLVAERGHRITLLAAARELGQQGDLAHADWLGASQADDACETRAAIGTGWDWLVTDHYGIDFRWQGALRDTTRRILAIDDLADRQLDCDMLLDQNLQVRPNRYAGRVGGDTLSLLGPDFALLRPAFAEVGSRTTPRPLTDGARALVYFGGVDPDGATMLALRGIVAAERGLAIDVVVGAGNPHREAIAEWASVRPDVTVHQGGADMPALMAEAALAFGASGATAWERCCLSLPTILITIAANQEPGAKALAEAGAAIWLGGIGEANVDAAAVTDTLRTLLEDPDAAARMAQRCRELCDGRGTERAAAAMQALSFVMRPVVEDDCDAIHAWRNAPDTRRYFHDDRPVALENHREWYAGLLADPDRQMWIGELDGFPVGVIRFDKGGRDAIVSVYMVPGETGRGLGAGLIIAGCRAAAAHWPDLETIDAEVLAENTASERAFSKAGFVPYGDIWRFALHRTIAE